MPLLVPDGAGEMDCANACAIALPPVNQVVQAFKVAVEAAEDGVRDRQIAGHVGHDLRVEPHGEGCWVELDDRDHSRLSITRLSPGTCPRSRTCTSRVSPPSSGR